MYAGMAGMEMLCSIGLAGVAGQISKLAGALLEGAWALGIKTKTPANSMGPLVVLQSTDADALVARLAQAGLVCSSGTTGCASLSTCTTRWRTYRKCYGSWRGTLGCWCASPKRLGWQARERRAAAIDHAPLDDDCHGRRCRSFGSWRGRRFAARVPDGYRCGTRGAEAPCNAVVNKSGPRPALSRRVECLLPGKTL